MAQHANAFNYIEYHAPYRKNRFLLLLYVLSDMLPIVCAVDNVTCILQPQ